MHIRVRICTQCENRNSQLFEICENIGPREKKRVYSVLSYGVVRVTNRPLGQTNCQVYVEVSLIHGVLTEEFLCTVLYV